MKLLIDDKVQGSDAEDALKSPALDDVSIDTAFVITLDATYDINAIGVGNTDATTITVNSEVVSLSATEKNGLYDLVTALNTDTLTVSHNGTYLGRFAAGVGRSIGVSPTREIGFYSTADPRITASANVVEGAGGVSGRRIDTDIRYKFTEIILSDIETAYQAQISKGFPMFIYFDKESKWIPWTRIYAQDINNILFQSSVNRILYSRRISWRERF